MTKALLQSLGEQVRPSAFLDCKAYLAALYDRLKKDSGDYSYQKYAAYLGFAPGTIMHQILRGNRPLTVKTAQKMANHLELSRLERKYFLTLAEYGAAKLSADRDQLFQELLNIRQEILPDDLDKRWLSYFNEWYHVVIREMVTLQDFSSDPHWIAQQITPRLRPEQAAESLALLEDLQLIRKNPDTGKYEQCQQVIATGSRVRGMGLTRYHQQMMEHAKESLTRIPGKSRDISAMTLAVDDVTAQKLRAMIHEFQQQLMQAANSSGQADRVVQINLQLFPFTSIENGARIKK